MKTEEKKNTKERFISMWKKIKKYLIWFDRTWFIVSVLALTITAVYVFFFVPSFRNLCLGALGSCSVLMFISWARNRYSPYRLALLALDLLLFFVFLAINNHEPVCWTEIGTYLENNILVAKWDWLAFIIASVSLIFAACTWSSQERTQKNTLQTTPESQFGMLKDFVRHTYRNIAVIYAIEYLMEGHYRTHYPAEEHILKLRSDDTSINPSLFADNHDKSGMLQRLRFNLRNGNLELNVIANRLKDENVCVEMKMMDIQTIKKRLDYSIERVQDIMKNVWGYSEKEIAEKILDYVVDKAANANDKKSDYTELHDTAKAAFDKNEIEYYYTGKDSKGKYTKFINVLFPDDKGGSKDNPKSYVGFLLKLNQNIYAEIYHPERIHLIPFSKEGHVLPRK